MRRRVRGQRGGLRQGGHGRRRRMRLRLRWRDVAGHDAVEVGEGAELALEAVLVGGAELEALPAAEEGAVLEHGDGARVERPEGALARAVGAARDLDEAVVEAEVVAQRVLPALRVLAVVGEVVHDELVDVGEGQHPLGRVPQRHRRQRDVRVGRLLVAVRLATRPRHLVLELVLLFLVLMEVIR